MAGLFIRYYGKRKIEWGQDEMVAEKFPRELLQSLSPALFEGPQFPLSALPPGKYGAQRVAIPLQKLDPRPYDTCRWRWSQPLPLRRRRVRKNKRHAPRSGNLPLKKKMKQAA